MDSDRGGVELSGAELDDRVADWQTVALGYADHPVVQSLRQCLEAFTAKRAACHYARGQAQVAANRLRLAYIALFGVDCSRRMTDDEMYRRLGLFLDNKEPGWEGLIGDG